MSIRGEMHSRGHRSGPSIYVKRPIVMASMLMPTVYKAVLPTVYDAVVPTIYKAFVPAV